MTRADRLDSLLAERDLDLLLVTNLVNVRYLTAFSGTNALVLVGPGVRRFVTDFRYVERAAAEVPREFGRERAPQELIDHLPEVLPPGSARLGFDDDHLSVKQRAHMGEILADEIELVPAGGLVEELRAVKDADELGRIRSAAALADDIYAWVLERGLVGRTERDVVIELEHELRLRGAEPAFPSIVAAADNGALPHALPRDVEIPSGTLVILDIGAQFDGYCSDCTRTVATGKLDDDAHAVYELVSAAQRAGLEAIRPGTPASEADASARTLIEEAGHGEHFGHGLGHGVGIEVHEGPRVSKISTATLQAGNVVTVEPGVYLPGRFGVRIEDLVVVTDDGCEVISRFPKELLEVS